MNFFVDTSALYALIDGDDANHPPAKAFFLACLDRSDKFFSSNYVILETVALIQRRLGLNALRDFINILLPVFHLYWVEEKHHDVGLRVLMMNNECDLSLVDCTSFEIMRLNELEDAFAFDRHFAQQGFRCHP
ncbi:MAG: type II toxin-antitoxin system VapC family toxin [Anaerolineales bacterium]